MAEQELAITPDGAGGKCRSVQPRPASVESECPALVVSRSRLEKIRMMAEHGVNHGGYDKSLIKLMAIMADIDELLAGAADA